MKKFYRPLLLVLAIAIATMFFGCYYVESREFEDYNSFLTDMELKAKDIHSFLPKLENDKFVDDMYFRFTEYDIFDSTYIVYLKCTYDAETFNKELQRLKSEYPLAENSDSFDYNAIAIEGENDVYHFNSESTDNENIYAKYTYALYDESTAQIVYITIRTKGENKMLIDNIPSQYLPKEIIGEESAA